MNSPDSKIRDINAKDSLCDNSTTCNHDRIWRSQNPEISSQKVRVKKYETQDFIQMQHSHNLQIRSQTKQNTETAN